MRLALLFLLCSFTMYYLTVQVLIVATVVQIFSSFNYIKPELQFKHELLVFIIIQPMNWIQSVHYCDGYFVYMSLLLLLLLLLLFLLLRPFLLLSSPSSYHLICAAMIRSYSISYVYVYLMSSCFSCCQPHWVQ
jgi:hypothetical protein